MNQPIAKNNSSISQHNFKSASMNNEYQSTFMPIFSQAEAKIKKYVVLAFVMGLGMAWLRYQITMEVVNVKRAIPKDLVNRASYINGLILSSNLLIKQYQKAKDRFVIHLKKENLPKSWKPDDFVSNFEETKGSPQIEWYNKELEKYITKVNNQPFVAKEDGKHAISLWQKAELDVRYNKQMEMLNEFSGEEYAYISSHPDCSERCSTFQGCLVSLHKHSTKNPPKKIKSYKELKKSDFFVEKVDGVDVYSLPDIMAVVDKYGYNNNIICGFNCRHHLLHYHKGKVPPKEFSAKEIKAQRDIEQKIREMERHIRSLKMELNVYNSISKKDKTIRLKIINLRAKIKHLVEVYKKFCNDNGYAWYDYRIKVSDNEIFMRK